MADYLALLKKMDWGSDDEVAAIIADWNENHPDPAAHFHLTFDRGYRVYAQVGTAMNLPDESGGGKKRRRPKKSSPKSISIFSTTLAPSSEAFILRTTALYQQIFSQLDNPEARSRSYIRYSFEIWSALKAFENSQQKVFEELRKLTKNDSDAYFHFNEGYKVEIDRKHVRTIQEVAVYVRKYPQGIEKVYQENSFGAAQKEACSAHIDQFKAFIDKNQIKSCAEKVEELSGQLDPISWYYAVNTIGTYFKTHTKQKYTELYPKGKYVGFSVYIAGLKPFPEIWPEDKDKLLEKHPELATTNPEQFHKITYHPETPIELRLEIERRAQSTTQQS